MIVSKYFNVIKIGRNTYGSSPPHSISPLRLRTLHTREPIIPRVHLRLRRPLLAQPRRFQQQPHSPRPRRIEFKHPRRRRAPPYPSFRGVHPVSVWVEREDHIRRVFSVEEVVMEEVGVKEPVALAFGAREDGSGEG